MNSYVKTFSIMLTASMALTSLAACSRSEDTAAPAKTNDPGKSAQQKKKLR